MTAVKESRKELFDSAVSFLGDPSVKDAPLTKKVEFLQSKGLTQSEVELALKESQETPKDSKKPLSFQTEGHRISGDDHLYEAVPPPLPRRDWKDYFVMATATAGLFYGVYEITKRYVIPNMLPEAKSKLEQDKEEIQSQFDKVDRVLNAIEQEQEVFRTKDDEKLEELENTIVQLQNCLEQTTNTREKMEGEFKILKLEMTNLQSTIDKFILNKDGLRELEKINAEMNSLKSLIKNSGFSESSSGNNSENNGHNSPLPKNFVPGADAIPSAAEILSKMNIGKKDTNSNTPAWKKAREESLGATTSSIPEWQKNSLNEVNVPNWQHTVEAAEHEQEDETDNE